MNKYNTKQKCDICGKKFKYKEVYVACLTDEGGKFNECMKCAEKYTDVEPRENIVWAAIEHGVGYLSFNESDIN